jgi:hypothetical protein
MAAAHATPPGEVASEAQFHLEPFDYSGVRLLDGMLKKQYEATRDFYFKIPNDDILLGFRRRAGQPAPGNELPGWYGQDEFNAFPQWLSGMSRMAKATGDKEILNKATLLMREWAKTIEPNGYFYYSRNPIAPHYTYEKTVCGLVDLYHYGGQGEALPLLEKITDWAIANLDRRCPNPDSKDPTGSGGGTRNSDCSEWYTLSENLYRAYKFTGSAKYKTFGDLWRYPHYWGMFSGESEPAPYGLHAYSHCNTLSSAAMTYEITGEEQYLKTLINAYDYFARTQFYATGGFGPDEALVRPDGSLGKSLENTVASFETPCGSWACFKLGKYLQRFTGEARYGDWIEKMVYNGIGAALPMSGRGDTFYYSDYNIGGAHKVYSKWGPFPCCSGTFPQAVADYHNIIYYKDSNNLYVNLFVPSSVTWDYDGDDITVEQATNYPESEITTLTVSPTRSAAFGLKLRIPEWCMSASIEVNGSKQDVVCQPGKWALVERRWNSGDRLTLRIPMSLRLVPVDQQHPKRAAVMQGPVVLVRLHDPTMFTGGRDPSQWMHPSGRPLEYHIQPQPSGPFVPFYQVGGYTTAYGMYFDLKS